MTGIGRKAAPLSCWISLVHPSTSLVLGSDSADETAIRTSFDLAARFKGISLPRAFPGIRRFYERAKRFGWATGLLDDVRDRAGLLEGM